MMRVILFLLTNVSIMLCLGLILNFTSLNSHSIYGMMLISGVIGFLGSIISLLMSKWIALNTVGGIIIQTPKNNTETWLLNTIYKLSNKVKIKSPELAIYESSEINAFATGFKKNSSLIAISTGLINKMNYEEIEAVLAHEISHINSGDMITMSLIQGILNTFVFFISRLLTKIICMGISTNKKEENEEFQYPMLFYFLSTILETLFGLLASIIILWFSRRREFYADAGAAKIIGKYNMIAALKKLQSNYVSEAPNSIITLCIHGKSKSILKLFQSHPTLEIRIQFLYNEKYM